MEGHYYSRVVDEYFRRKLSSTGALVVEGPKWCGKTTTAEGMAASALYVQDPDYTDYYIEQARRKPSVLLEGDKPRLIDEWQDIPKIWDAVRFDVDRNGYGGRYILTGSVVIKEADDEERKHSGTGRMAFVHMNTMSLFESEDSNGEVSFKGLFDGETDYSSRSDMTLEDLAFVLCRGGWPRTVGMDKATALEPSKDYYRAVVYEDMSRVDGVRRNPIVVDHVLKSLSRNICTMADTSNIAEDVKQVATRQTVTSYIGALRKLFVVDDIPSWRPALLSKARMRASPKRCFADPSIATAALGAGPGTLIKDMPSFGSLFEALAIRDLRVYSQVIDGQVYHYHDTTGLEVDAIVSLADGRWCAIEIKLNSGEDEGARNLIRFRNKTRLADGTGPSFLAVLTGTGFYHVRPDGVLVIPIGCLGP